MGDLTLSYVKPSAKEPNGKLNTEPLAESLRVSSRKVSSRRRALQDFYKIADEASAPTKKAEPKPNEFAETAQANTEEPEEMPSVSIDFDDPKAVKEFLRLASIQQMLEVRNGVSGKLLSQELTKKAIIYDNYYELIKLRQILEGVSKSSIVNTNTATSALDNLSNLKSRTDPSAQSVEQTLGDLKRFVNHEAAVFNSDFDSVVANIVSRGRLDSAASITAIAEDDQDELGRMPLSSQISAVLDKSLTNEALKELIASVDSENVLLQRDLEALAQ